MSPAGYPQPEISATEKTEYARHSLRVFSCRLNQPDPVSFPEYKA